MRVTIESMEGSMDKQLVDQIVVRENQQIVGQWNFGN